MLVSDFIRAKNEIIFRHTGIILVPEEQIEECEKKPLVIATSHTENVCDTKICPYCMVYYEKGLTEEMALEGETLCDGCPMDRADNNCNYLEGSTYRSVVNSLRTCAIADPRNIFYDELSELVEQYNKELENDSE